MSIRRGPRPDTRFYTVSKDISEDTRLSWAARGMLIFLLGKPDNWQVSVSHLIKQTENSQKPVGRDAVRGLIRELIDAGYMQAETRREGGAFNGIDYVVSEIPDASPETGNPAPANPQSPETENPAPAYPAPANPPVIKNDHHQGMKEPTKNDIPAAENSAPAAGETGVSVVLSNQQQDADTKTAFKSRCRATWEAYARAYCDRYGIMPVRNATTNTQTVQLVKRLGEEAAAVADFYVRTVNEAFIVKNMHSLGHLLKGAEGYYTQWATKCAMTTTRARQIDSTQANASAADEAIAMLRAKREREGRA